MYITCSRMPPNFFHPLNFHLFTSTSLHLFLRLALYTSLSLFYTPLRSACLQLAGIDLSSINSN